MNLADLPNLPADERPIHWSATGLPLATLTGRIARAMPTDIRGGFIDRELYVYVDWRLQALQKNRGVPITKLADVDED